MESIFRLFSSLTTNQQQNEYPKQKFQIPSELENTIIPTNLSPLEGGRGVSFPGLFQFTSVHPATYNYSILRENPDGRRAGKRRGDEF
jgi:hypothetical protein